MLPFFRTTLLLAALTALFMGCGYLMGGQQGAIMALVLAGGMNFFAWFYSDKMVLMQYGAQEASARSAPNFYAIVQDLAARAALPMPKVYIMQSPQPNAFATGRGPNHAAVCASTGLLERLSHDEIEGVMAHELAHIKNRDMLTMTIAATLAGALGYLANMAMWMGLHGRSDSEGRRTNPLLMLLLMMIAPLAATLVQLTISRTREYEADRIGAIICGKPRALASALANISQQAGMIPMRQAEANPATAHLMIANPLSGGGLGSLFSTHPPMQERIRRLLAMSGENIQISPWG